MNYGSGPLGETPSAVGVYRSDVETATSCPQGNSNGGLTHPECWPTRRVVDVAGPGRFLDKEWMDVGRSGSAGEVVWIAYGDAIYPPPDVRSTRATREELATQLRGAFGQLYAHLREHYQICDSTVS